jgi:CO/xanthine dehydrogenase FAD-binding subunit
VLRPFAYHRPTSIDELVELLSTIKDSCVLAGGTDLLVKLREGKHVPPAIIDLKRIPELGKLSREGDTLVIGALATVTELLEYPGLADEPGLDLLREAAAVFGCLEIRHRATICGNIAHASPGAEYGSCMYVLEATVVIHGPSGERTLPVAEFYKGPNWNALEQGEFLKALRVPIPPKSARSSYMRRSRVKGMDLAGLNLAMLVLNPDDPAKRQLRLAMGAVHKVPMRAPEVEAMLSGRPITAELMAEAKRALSDSINPRPSSLRASPAYKKAMVAHLAESALEKLLPRFPEEVAP